MKCRMFYGALSWVFLLRFFLPYLFRSEAPYSPSPGLQGPLNLSQHALNASSPGELQTLVNMSNFQFTLMSPPCQSSLPSSQEPSLLFVVHSAPDHFSHRQTIRGTWGSDKGLRVVFLLGQVANWTLQHSLEAESVRYKDLVQGNFLDTYRNLTYKQVMGLKWISFFCPQVAYIFKVDDDVFIDVPQLKGYLAQTHGPRPSPNLLLCYLIRYPYAKRSHRSKWRVSFKEYAHAYYPSYCSGFVVGMSADVALRLHRASSTEPFFWIDDVFVSGILASRAGLSHIDLTSEVPASESLVTSYLSSSSRHSHHPPPMFGAPDLRLDTIRDLWRKAQEYYNP